jgi:hypothetical protein
MIERVMIDAVNRFWFEELTPEDWFKKSEARRDDQATLRRDLRSAARGCAGIMA